MTFPDITTITHRAMIGDWLNEAGLIGEGVEIGVQEGKNAEAILSRWKGTLHLVDPWERQDPTGYRDGTNDIDFEDTFTKCCERMKPFRGRYVFNRAYSDDAFLHYLHEGKQFSFCYIDANHSSPQIDRDLENWWQLVAPGGLFGGHDYLDLDAPEWRCDVKHAVDEFVAKHNLKLHITYDQSTETEGGWPSWWILKP